MLRRKRNDDLAWVPVLADVPRKQREAFVRAGREVDHADGAVIIREGDEGVGLHLILEGKAEVTAAGRSITTFGAGELFGEMGVLGRARRTATVTATTPVRTLSIPSWSIMPLLGSAPELATAISEEIQRRLGPLAGI